MARVLEESPAGAAVPEPAVSIMSEEQQLAAALEASRAEMLAPPIQPSRTVPTPSDGHLGLSEEEEQLARAIEESTQASRPAAATLPPSPRLDHSGLQAELDRLLSSTEADMARAIEESLRSAPRGAEPSSTSHRQFMQELEHREREMHLEDAAAGGLVTAMHSLQGDMTEEQALEMALQASRFQLEQHAVLSQGERRLLVQQAPSTLSNSHQAPSASRANGSTGRLREAARSSSTDRHSRSHTVRGAIDANGGSRPSADPGRAVSCSAGAKRPAAGPRPPARSTLGASAPRQPPGGLHPSAGSGARLAEANTAGLAALQQSLREAERLAEHNAPGRIRPLSGRSRSQPLASRAEAASSAAALPRSSSSAVEASEATVVRHQQDGEYEASLAADRARDAALRRAREEADRAEAERVRLEEEARTAKEAAARREEERAVSARRELAKLEDLLKGRLPEEPLASDPDSCELAVDAIPIDKRFTRRFPRDCMASCVYDFVRVAVIQAALTQQTPAEAGGALAVSQDQGDGAIQQAEALSKAGSFKLVQNFAPAPLPEDGSSLQSCGVARRDKFIVRPC